MNWCMVPKVASSSVSELILPYLKKLNIKFPFPQLEVWTRAGRLTYSDFVQQLQAGSPCAAYGSRGCGCSPNDFEVVSGDRHTAKSRPLFFD